MINMVLAALLSGSVIHIQNTVLCDTPEQLVAILEARRDDGWEAAQALLREYNNTWNEYNEPVCAPWSGWATYIELVDVLPSIPIDHTTSSTAYIIWLEVSDRAYVAITRQNPDQEF